MKSRIFTYLLIFAVLFILFQYINTKKYVQSATTKIENLKTETKKLRDSVQHLSYENLDLAYFSLAHNEEARSYFDHLNIKNLPRFIADKLLETNESKGDNPLIPYTGMKGTMKINKIKILNHKWIVADFSDGKYWGELFIKYEIKNDLTLSFTVMDHLFYPEN
jgi:hypothetical protein